MRERIPLAYTFAVFMLLICFAAWACPFWPLKILFVLLVPPIGWLIYATVRS